MDAEAIMRESGNDEDVIKHTERVVEICGKLADDISGAKINCKLLKDAAWLHDVAREKYGDDHHEPESVRDVLDEFCLDSDLLSEKETLISIIAQHKGDFNPPKGYELESAVLRISDKLDKFIKSGKKKAIKACCNSLKKIKKKIMPSSALSASQFSDICESSCRFSYRFCKDELREALREDRIFPL